MSDKITGAENIIWDLSDLYAGIDDPRIETDTQQMLALADTFVDEFRGKVAHLTAAQLTEAYQAMEMIYDLAYKQYFFASLNYTTASTDPTWGAFMQRRQELLSQLQQKLVFFGLEWNELDDEKAQQLLADPSIAQYRYYLETERLNKPYQLSEIEEQLLIEKSVTGEQAWVRFYDQMLAALKFDIDGKQVPMSKAITRLHERDRKDRQQAQESITATLKEKSMELTFVFNVLLADKASDDKMRKYPTWITSRNISNKAPDAVVDALVNTVTANYDIVARHYRLKRQLLKLDELTDYDRYAPLNLKDSDTFYTWEQAREIVLNAFNSFSPTMAMAASLFFEKKWIHAPVLDGKRNGAYANYGTKATHPYVFMNYTGRARDVMTLAHELGHGVHMYLAGRKQPLFGIFTPLTTAEMASTFAEMLVFNDLTAKESDPEVQLGMLCGKVEDSFATIFRQVSMNRFENAIHTARRQEGELTTERFSALWMDTQRAMFKDSVRMTDNYSIWWSYISHFLHTPGYVYAYAFGELLVLSLYNLYQKEGKGFIPKYEDLLSAGGSDYPDRLLAKVGVDLNDLTFWQEGINALSSLVDREEALVAQLG